MAKVPGTEKPGPRGRGLGAAVGAGQGGTVCVGELCRLEEKPLGNGGVWEGGGGARGLNGRGRQGGSLLGFVEEQGGPPGQAAPHGAGGVRACSPGQQQVMLVVL